MLKRFVKKYYAKLIKDLTKEDDTQLLALGVLFCQTNSGRFLRIFSMILSSKYSVSLEMMESFNI